VAPYECRRSQAAGDNGICRATCDGAADPISCPQAQPICMIEQMPDGSLPGYCAPTAPCTPGNTRATCGHDATCIVGGDSTVCDWPGNAAVGAVCDPGSDDPAKHCQANLACVYGECKAACGANNACPNGQRCIDYTDRLNNQPFRFCHASCDMFAQRGCAAGQTCRFSDIDGGGIIASCEDSAMGRATQGQACQPSDSNYWGTCTGAYLCSPLQQGDPAECLGLCDTASASHCGGHSYCGLSLLGDQFSGILGLCAGECDAIATANTGCGAGQYCLFGFVGLDHNGHEQAAGFCKAGPQLHNTGETCTVDENTGEHDCRTGHVCAALQQGADPVCVRICHADGNECAAGSQCVTGVFGDMNNPSQEIGACVPQQ
jgi:hypothetical protein